MTSVALSEKEMVTLISALDSYLSDLATERVGTDNREWHAELKEREQIISTILERLRAVAS